MSAKKVENAVEETAKEEVKKVEETAEKTAVSSNAEAEEIKTEEPIKEEEVIIEEENIIPEEEAEKLKEEEVKEVEAKKVTIEKGDKVKLKVLVDFTDKYTNESYKINDEIAVDKDRAKELLADSRRLVTK